MDKELDVGMGLFVFLFGAVNHPHHPPGPAGIHGVETGGEERQGHGFVRAEEVSALHGKAGHGTFLAHEPADDDIPKADGVHGHQLGVQTGFIVHYDVVVLRHDLVYGLFLQQFLDIPIPRGVHERGKMAKAEIHGREGQVRIQGGKDAGYVHAGGILLLQDVTEFFHGGTQFTGGYRMLRIPGRNLDEYLVFEFYFAESQFVINGRTGEELDNVLFQVNVQAKPDEHQRTGNHQDVHQRLPILEEMINGQEYSVH